MTSLDGWVIVPVTGIELFFTEDQGIRSSDLGEKFPFLKTGDQVFFPFLHRQGPLTQGLGHFRIKNQNAIRIGHDQISRFYHHSSALDDGVDLAAITKQVSWSMP